MEELKSCEYCGRKFIAHSANRRFCSIECRHFSYTENADKEPTVYQKVCPICGKVFETDLICQKYCSHDCYRDSYQLNSSSVIKICPNCGQKFIVKHKNQKYCSDTCRNDFNKKRKEEKVRWLKTRLRKLTQNF